MAITREMADSLDNNYILQAIHEKIRKDMRDKLVEKVLEAVKSDLITIVEESLKDIETSEWAFRNFQDYTQRLVCEVKDRREK